MTSRKDPSLSYSQSSRGLTFFLLALILVVAAVLRFSELELMEYKGDASRTVGQISEVVDEGVFLTHGEPSSKGLTHSPLNVYLLAPVWMVNPSPLALAWFIALLNVAAVGVTFVIGWRFLSPRAGLIAAAFFAVSPWAVVFSRNIWRPDMMPLFGALLISSALSLVAGGRRRSVFWVCLWSAVLAQLYQPGYLAVGAVLLFLVIYRPRVSPLALIFGLIAVTVLFLPYGIFLAKGGWRELLELFLGRLPCKSCSPASSMLQKIEPVWSLVNVGRFESLISETANYVDAKLGASAFLLYPFAALERWMFIGGFGWFVGRALFPGNGRRNDRPILILLSLFIALHVVACLVSNWQCELHYFAPILPAMFLIIGATFDGGLTFLQSWLGSTSRYRVASALAGLVLLGTLLTQIHFTATLYSVLRASGGASGTYGVTYRDKVKLADYLAKSFGPGCFDLVHEWHPLSAWGVATGYIDDIVRRKPASVPCVSTIPARLFVLETIPRPLSQAAEEHLEPFKLFGPIVLYTKASTHEP